MLHPPANTVLTRHVKSLYADQRCYQATEHVMDNASTSKQCQLTKPDSVALALLSLMEAVVLVNKQGVIEFINEPACKLLSPSSDTEAISRQHACVDAPSLFIAQQWDDYLLEPLNSILRKMREHAQTSRMPVNHAPSETVLQLRDGSSKDVEISITYFGHFEPLFAIVIRDLTQYRLEYQQLQQWASTDSLTQLANRRIFDTELKKHWQACTYKKSPISLLLIDIDHFKSFNDQYGHIIGDACLKKIAEAIAAALTAPDHIAARYGGEEFALVLPHTNAEHVERIAQCVQKHINAISYTDIGLKDSVSVSVSQGHASEINGQYRTSTALLCAADTALYRAKANGRNRINACL